MCLKPEGMTPLWAVEAAKLFLCVTATVKHSSKVGIVYVVCLHIVVSKAAFQKRSSMEAIEPPLDPPLVCDS